MTAVEEKISQLKVKKDEIRAGYAEFQPIKRELVAEYEAKRAELETQYLEKINALEKPLQAKMEVYKAEVKAYFGTADGEEADALSLISTIARVVGMHD